MCLLLSTLHVLYCWSVFCLLISLSVIFSDTYGTDCDYIYCSRISINRFIKNLFSLPAVPSWCVLHHVFAMFCVPLISLCSFCLCLAMGLCVCVADWMLGCLSNMYQLCSDVVQALCHTMSQLSSVYMLFLVCGASTSPPLCCMHAKPEQHMCFLASYECSHPAGIWILISCCNWSQIQNILTAYISIYIIYHHNLVTWKTSNSNIYQKQRNIDNDSVCSKSNLDQRLQ